MRTLQRRLPISQDTDSVQPSGPTDSERNFTRGIQHASDLRSLAAECTLFPYDGTASVPRVLIPLSAAGGPDTFQYPQPPSCLDDVGYLEPAHAEQIYQSMVSHGFNP